MFLLLDLISLIVFNDHLPNLPNYFVEWPTRISHPGITTMLRPLKNTYRRVQGNYR